MKLKHKLHFFLAFILFILPISVWAIPEYVVPGGENIGIKVSNEGVIVVGFYEVVGVDVGRESGLVLGDVIKKVNGEAISSIDDMVAKMETGDIENTRITYERNGKEYDTTLSVTKDDNGVYKTGLYVKDSILGIGSITYIDTSSGIATYGALGHEIDEKNTAYKIEVKEGKIFASTVTGITKGTATTPGSKNARFDSSKILGNIKANEASGIYGTYSEEVTKEAMKVGTKDDIQIGPATILTVLNGDEVEEFDIEILNLDPDHETKNILFQVTDERLLESTGGIVQGMSGSPIIQNDMIIGAVTHVVVSDPAKGYGIYLTTMLDEAEKQGT